MTQAAFQDVLPGLTCFGCGPENNRGLRIKSYWSGEDEAICQFSPEPYHNGPPDFVNGGIIATVIDCHAVCTAMADAYRREGRAVGEGRLIPYVTGTLNIRFCAPTAMTGPLEVRAKIVTVTPKKTVLSCEVIVEGELTVSAEVIAIRISNS